MVVNIGPSRCRHRSPLEASVCRGRCSNAGNVKKVLVLPEISSTSSEVWWPMSGRHVQVCSGRDQDDHSAFLLHVCDAKPCLQALPRAFQDYAWCRKKSCAQAGAGCASVCSLLLMWTSASLPSPLRPFGRRQGFLLGSTLVQDMFFGFPHSSSTRVLSVGCQRLSVGFLCLVLFGSSVGVAVFRDVVVQCVVSWC